MRGGPGAAVHPCPGGCGIPDVPHHRLACVACWKRLPLPYRQLINATYQCRNLFPRDHRQAIADALRWYAEHPPGSPPQGVIPHV